MLIEVVVVVVVVVASKITPGMNFYRFHSTSQCWLSGSLIERLFVKHECKSNPDFDAVC